jgi:hypothetical protein
MAGQCGVAGRSPWRCEKENGEGEAWVLYALGAGEGLEGGAQLLARVGVGVGSS